MILLLRNAIAIVPNERLAEELAATTFMQTGSGRLIMALKDDMSSGRGGGSPDAADAVSMAFAPTASASTHLMYV